MSWHIHYNTNTSDFARFRAAFRREYADLFPPSGWGCPFTPLTPEPDYQYICDFEGSDMVMTDAEDAKHEDLSEAKALKDALADDAVVHVEWYGPFETPTQSFFVPKAHGEAIYERVVKPDFHGYVDVLLHPNTGCMAGDHEVRARWSTAAGRAAPAVRTQGFPCNIPGYSCGQTFHPCNCKTYERDQAPEHSCSGCHKTAESGHSEPGPSPHPPASPPASPSPPSQPSPPKRSEPAAPKGPDTPIRGQPFASLAMVVAGVAMMLFLLAALGAVVTCRPQGTRLRPPEVRAMEGIDMLDVGGTSRA